MPGDVGTVSLSAEQKAARDRRSSKQQYGLYEAAPEAGVEAFPSR